MSKSDSKARVADQGVGKVRVCALCIHIVVALFIFEGLLYLDDSSIWPVLLACVRKCASLRSTNWRVRFGPESNDRSRRRELSCGMSLKAKGVMVPRGDCGVLLQAL